MNTVKNSFFFRGSPKEQDFEFLKHSHSRQESQNFSKIANKLKHLDPTSNLSHKRSDTPISGYSSSDDDQYGASATQPLIYNDAVSIQLHQPRSDMATGDISQVLVFYTGGTIGMKNTNNHGYVPVPNYLTDNLAGMSRFHDHAYYPSFRRFILDNNDLSEEETHPTNKVIVNDLTKDPPEQIETVRRCLITPPSLVGKRIRYSVIEYEPLLDSCNMTSDDWIRIATDIELNYESYDAFIILHGTDTMAYTASALSFLLEDLGKTVILTGSQVPLSEVRNDAIENLLGALTIAGHYVIPEVSLFFNNKLFRGNRSVKMNAVEFNAFDSPNLAPLATVGINIDVNWAEIVRPSSISRFKAHKALNRNVSSLRLFPGITESTVKALLAEPIEGVILETYGAGNAPDTRNDIMRALASASDRGVVIVNCTQCKKGVVTDLYATGKALRRVGVVSGNDMTPECALVKLAYLLGEFESGKRYPPKVVRELMTKNLRGELTVVAPKPRFTFHNRTHKIIQNMIYAASDANQAAATDSSLMMNVQEKVLMEKSLYPILLCSAAGTDDLDGMLLLSENYEGMMLMLNCMDYDGRTPLHIACTGGHHRIVKFLLQNGASVHMRDRFGHTPLYEAARNKHKHVINTLREAGAHFNDAEIDDVVFQSLSAAAKGDVELLKHFVDSGIDINRTGFDHRTALHHAVAEGCLNTVQFLLSLPDINTETKDRWGRKPIDDAEMNLGRMWGRDNETEKQLREIVRLLREKTDYAIDEAIVRRNTTHHEDLGPHHLSGVNGVVIVVNGDK
ncbi:13868_t:CDS:10 [Funneliformis geosporum]|uniref:asparaginase n=1 Tax=Funneliformis geosporum TaxID=1117311 RepID=A0A9W4WTK1_9GLOM|nr:13868_t:CDS:10 [Funneliformis geosporum]